MVIGSRFWVVDLDKKQTIWAPALKSKCDKQLKSKAKYFAYFELFFLLHRCFGAQSFSFMEGAKEKKALKQP